MNYLNETSTYTKNTNRYKNQKRNSTSKKLTFSRISTFSNILLVCFYWSGIRDYVPSCAIVAIRSVSEHIKTIENKSLLFPLQCCSVQVFFLFSLFYDRFGFPPETRKWKTARNSPRTAVKSNFSLHENTYTHNKKGRLTHRKTKGNINKTKVFCARETKWFYFFRFKFYYLRE